MPDILGFRQDFPFLQVCVEVGEQTVLRCISLSEMLKCNCNVGRASVRALVSLWVIVTAGCLVGPV